MNHITKTRLFIATQELTNSCRSHSMTSSFGQKFLTEKDLTQSILLRKRPLSANRTMKLMDPSQLNKTIATM